MTKKRGSSAMRARWACIAVLVLLTSAIFWQGSTSPTQAAETPPVLQITKDTVLDPAKSYGRIVIRTSNVTLDGRGASVIGATKGDTTTYKQIGIFAAGVSGVTLKNVKSGAGRPG